MTHDTAALRRFLLDRHTDISGCSGTGVVAEGVTFSDGTTVVHWLREPYGTSVYRSFEDVRRLHGHGGCTAVVLVDG